MLSHWSVLLCNKPEVNFRVSFNFLCWHVVDQSYFLNRKFISPAFSQQHVFRLLSKALFATRGHCIVFRSLCIRSGFYRYLKIKNSLGKAGAYVWLLSSPYFLHMKFTFWPSDCVRSTNQHYNGFSPNGKVKMKPKM